MRLDNAGLHFALDPLRQAIALLILSRKLPDRRNITVNQAICPGFGFLDVWIDLARDDVLDPDKILMRAPIGNQRNPLREELLLELAESILHGSRPHHDALL